MMKLYYHPASSPSRTARMTAALLGLELELELVDLFGGANRTREYLALNPNGLVPTLVDDGFVLWESNAIAQYLASKRATPELFPDDPQLRADVTRWQCWELEHWKRATQAIAFERVFKRLKGLAPDPAALERGTAEFHRFAAVLDGQLARRDHLVGERLTLADVAVASGLTYATVAAFPLDGYPHLQRWAASIARLDAWQRTAPPDFS